METRILHGLDPKKLKEFRRGHLEDGTCEVLMPIHQAVTEEKSFEAGLDSYKDNGQKLDWTLDSGDKYLKEFLGEDIERMLSMRFHPP